MLYAAGGSASGTEASQADTALDAASAAGLYILGGNTSTEFVVDGGGEEVPHLRLFFISSYFLFLPYPYSP